MIDEKSVDTEGFDEIFSKMRRKIAEIYPAWSDYNYHDPGITLLELFAFLKENQNYYMNRTSDKIYNNFLRLAFQLPQSAESATLSIDLKANENIHLNDKFYVEEIVFESDENVTLAYENIDYIKVDNMSYKNEFSPFSQIPKEEAEFSIILKNELKEGNSYILSVKTTENPNRNAITKDFIPLASMKMYYNDQETYFIDNTYCFLQSGEIKFTVPCVTSKPSQSVIKFRLGKCDYDVAPFIEKISFSTIKLSQRDTKAYFCAKEELDFINTTNKIIDFYECDGDFFKKAKDGEIACIYDADFYDYRVLAIGNGFPNQAYKLRVDGYIKNASLLVENPMHKGKFEIYEFVQDFEDSSKISEHFCLKGNEIHFGDGIKGRCPEGEIIISSIAFTKGYDGNISKGNTLSFKGNDFVMENESFGGENPQSYDEMFEKTEDTVPTRLVTNEDFETAVKNTSGLIIDDCKVLDDYEDNVVSIVIKPSGVRATLSPIYKKNITKFLEPKRLLGTEIKIYSPTYTAIEVYIDIDRSPLYLNAKKAIENALHSYFSELKTFGAVTEYSVLYQKIDALTEVVKINSFNLSARGEGVVRNRKGDVITRPNSVTMLESAEILVNDML